MNTQYRFVLFIAGLCLILFTGGTGLLAKDTALERFALQSEDGKVTYIVDVWLPHEYLTHPRPYPMLLMLDGDYAFNSCVRISELLQRNGETKEFIVVAVSYEVGFGPPLAAERSRDFTPPLDSARLITKSETAYYRFIRDRLLPHLQAKYQVEPGQKTLWGYSLSGSFALWLNYFDPTLFDHYIVASGNMIDFGIMQKLFQAQIFGGREYTGRRVFLSYDATEMPDPKTIEDGKKLLATKEVFPGYAIRLFLTKGESHASSWFVSLPASLRYVFGPNHEQAASSIQEAASPPAAPATPAHP